MAFSFGGTFWVHQYPADKVQGVVEALAEMGVAYLVKSWPDGSADLAANTPLPPPARQLPIFAVVDLLSGPDGDGWTSGGPWVPRLLVDDERGGAAAAPRRDADLVRPPAPYQPDGAA